MRHVLGIAAAAACALGLVGCVVHHHDRYDDDRYDRPYDAYGYHPPKRPPREEYELPTLVCASKDGRATRCPTDFPIKRADLDKRYSGSPCEYGRSWGYDRNEVWVDRGCRARFVLVPEGRWR